MKKLSLIESLKSIFEDFGELNPFAEPESQKKAPPNFKRQVIEKYTKLGWDMGISGQPVLKMLERDAAGIEKEAMNAYMKAYTAATKLGSQVR